MPLQGIFQNVQDWLTELWTYPVPLGIFLWAAIIVGAMVPPMVLAVLLMARDERKRRRE